MAAPNPDLSKQARLILANALSGFMQGRIRSRAFDRTVTYFAWGHDAAADAGVKAVAEELYCLYDDFRNEPIHVTDEQREALWRAWVFLQTDLEYVHAPGDEGDW